MNQTLLGQGGDRLTVVDSTNLGPECHGRNLYSSIGFPDVSASTDEPSLGSSQLGATLGLLSISLILMDHGG